MQALALALALVLVLAILTQGPLPKTRISLGHALLKLTPGSGTSFPPQTPVTYVYGTQDPPHLTHCPNASQSQSYAPLVASSDSTLPSVVPETQYQRLPQQRQPTVPSLQPSFGGPDPTPPPSVPPASVQPVPEPSAKPKRGRGRGRGGSTVGLEQGQATNAKGKGKAKQTEVPGEPKTTGNAVTERAPKRARTKAPTTAEAEAIKVAVAIHPIPQPAPFHTCKNSPWTPETIFAFASYFYSLEHYDFCKSNQLTAYHKISEEIFKGEITPKQIENFNTQLLKRFKIFKEVMSQTGMGTASDEAIQTYLDSQGYVVLASVIRRFRSSEVYPIMHEVLWKDPTVLKEFGLDPSCDNYAIPGQNAYSRNLGVVHNDELVPWPALGIPRPTEDGKRVFCYNPETGHAHFE
ncbi:hypothetical protein FRC08_005735 [Ceratobasidium sp. 394]|nr:hypothetical protein FRC08_005735 [Ceratobasidium sp. 394]